MTHDPDKWMDDPRNEEAVKRLLPYLVLFVAAMLVLVLVIALWPS